MRAPILLIPLALAALLAGSTIVHAEPGRYAMRNATAEATRQNSKYALHAQVQRKSAPKSLLEAGGYSLLSEVQAPTANCSDVIFRNGFD